VGLTLALPRGRLWADVQARLAAAGLPGVAGLAEDRQLLHEAADGWRYLLVRPADVPTFVREGVADAGVTGKDVLIEDGEGLYELCDLGVGRSHLAVAAPAAAPPWPALLAARGASLRVATSYPQATRAHFAARGLQPRVIRLRGSVELAPQVNLADCIVDLVETGRTLAANGLVEVERIGPVTARLVANQQAYRWKGADLGQLIARLTP
jgi:ATP phosphoribosyltransferase